MLLDPEVIRMLLFGLALVLMMLFRPAGILPSALRKRELESKRPTEAALSTSRCCSGEGHRQALRRRAGAVRRQLHDRPRRDLRADRAQRRRQDPLFNVLTGIYAPDGGEFTFDGRPLNGLKPNEVAARGIARTFQNIRLFANLSALENVMVGRHVRTHAACWARSCATRGRAPRRGRSRSARYELLDYVGVAKRANDLAKHLPTATSAGSRSPARSRPSPSSSRSTSPRPA